MKKRRTTNFVDDIKIARPVRRSRTSQVDLLNGQGVGEHLGLVQESLNALGTDSPQFDNPTSGGGGSNPAPTTNTTTTSSGGISAPVVNAGPDQQITLPSSTATLTGSVSGSFSHTNTWSVVSAPAGATPTIANTSSEQTDVSNLTVPGTYTFQLFSMNKSLGGLGNSLSSNPTSLNSASDTVTITVLPAPTPPIISTPETPATPPPPPTQPQAPVSQMPDPADSATINGWGCDDLNKYLNIYNQVLSDPTLSQSIRTNYENALLQITNRINTVCVPSTVPHIDVPESAPPLPSLADIDAMDCNQLNSLKASLVTNEATYRSDASSLQNYINTVNYVNLQFTQKCKSPTPTAPTVEIYAPGTMPYSNGIRTSSVGSSGSGGGGSSSTNQPPSQNYKTWWWIGLIVVGAALLLYKPGTKIGTVGN